MEQLIDGDLASNNGGWQWSASTGVDPCPYFRIFNPYTQSLKVCDVSNQCVDLHTNPQLQADPTGDFIRHWVPELRKLRGPGKGVPWCSPFSQSFTHTYYSDLHNPSASAVDKLGYPRPIVKHDEARQRALRRYKNPGEE